MFTFQSNDRELDLQLSNKKVVEFRNYLFTTDKESIASLVRERCGRDVWELSALKVERTEAANEAGETPPKRRGRPPKIIAGMRMSESKGEEQ